jgi:hypothetical protein
MIISRRFKAGCLMTLLIGFCLGIGFVFGVLAHSAWKKKTEQPEFMKWAAMNHLKKLKPTADQKPKFEAKVDGAITELMGFKKQAMINIWDIIDRTTTSLNEDLTPEQKAEWEKIKPKRPDDVK